MTSVNIYLTFDGNCKEAFRFYKSVFGGEFSYISSFKDIPPEEDHPPIPDENLNRIMHVSLPISKETVLMGSDSSGAFDYKLVRGNNFSISVHTGNKTEANRIFHALAESGKITMPMADTFWDAYFGMCIDKFGIQWMVDCDLEKGN